MENNKKSADGYISRFEKALNEQNFVISGEVCPPKGTDIDPVIKEATHFYQDKVTAVNVTDQQAAVMRAGSMAISSLLKEKGIEPIFQITCRDRNRIALMSDILSAYILGIRNVLVLTGDHPVLGDHPGAKAVYDVDSVGLLKLIRVLESGSDLGKDLKGRPNQLSGVPRFFKGATVTITEQEMDMHIHKLEKKIEAGAQFIQTQAVYDPELFERFIERTKHLNVPVLAGILFIKSYRMGVYMNKNIPGIDISDKVLSRFKDASKEDRPRISLDVCCQITEKIKSFAAGIHVMPMGWDRLVPDFVKMIS